MAAVTRGLEAEAYDRQYDDRVLVRRIGRYFRPHRRKAGTVVVAVFLMALFGAAFPLIVTRGVSLVIGQERGAALWILVAIIFLVGALNWAVNWVRRRLAAEVIADVVMEMRRDAFRAAVRQDLSFYDEFSSGRVVSRISSDTDEFGQIITLSTDIVSQLFTSFILVAVLFTIEWRLTLAVLALAPFVTAAALGFRRLARRVSRQSSRALGEVNKAIQEAVTGISVAKNFRQEGAIYHEFLATNQQAYEVNVRRGFVLANIFPVLNVLGGFGTALLVYFGGRAAVAGAITIAAWYLFVATVDRFWFPIINVSSFWSQFQAGLAAAERTFALMDSEARVQQHAAEPVGALEGDIRFERVDFRYSSQEQVLQEFSLHIRAGESVAFGGHTGAGKSSIIKLIARFYEFQGGAIYVDGRDIRTFDLNDYRRHLGVVSQVPFLFSGSVAENIRYGRLEVGDAEIEAMARRIGDGEWLETLPNGLQSEVGERGSRLSMGQRQLVALTRVLAQRPSIFILDEATASVDPFTELQIQQALNLIMADSTAIIIAHRLSTVRSADRIVVLRRGRIIDEGTHEQLLAGRGHYAELYETYFRHQSLEAIHAPAWRSELESAG